MKKRRKKNGCLSRALLLQGPRKITAVTCCPVGSENFLGNAVGRWACASASVQPLGLLQPDTYITVIDNPSNLKSGLGFRMQGQMMVVHMVSGCFFSGPKKP